MSDKKTSLVVIGYSEGSYEYAVGAHAKEVMAYLNAGQSILHSHGATYKGEKMVCVPVPENDDLEHLKAIAERTFPAWVEELRKAQKE